MIITRLSGGLGNQMFQYAMGRALSIRNKTDLRIDISSFSSSPSKETPRSYALSNFAIKEKIASVSDFKNLGLPDAHDRSLAARLQRKLCRLTDSMKPLSKRRYIIETEFPFLEEAHGAGSDCFISGVWQSEKYFKDAEQAIRNDFALASPFSSGARKMYEAIAKGGSASVHIRRGDYVTNAKTNQKHSTCSPQYYQRAIDYILQKDPTAKFFIFSDDISWVQKNMSVPQSSVLVSTPSIADYEELMLMSACTHNIIANSSFSWWGAWLNKNQNKIVVAPKKWFNTSTPTHDLIPDFWIQL